MLPEGIDRDGTSSSASIVCDSSGAEAILLCSLPFCWLSIIYVARCKIPTYLRQGLNNMTTAGLLLNTSLVILPRGPATRRSDFLTVTTGIPLFSCLYTRYLIRTLALVRHQNSARRFDSLSHGARIQHLGYPVFSLSKLKSERSVKWQRLWTPRPTLGRSW